MLFRSTARSVHEARARLGTLKASELPVTDYDRLSASDAAKAAQQLDEVDDLNKIIHYEEANKNRHSVVSAAQTRHAALAQEIAGVR